MTLHKKAELGLLNTVKRWNACLLDKTDRYGYSVWHIAAGCNGLKDIPQHLFTKDVLKTNSPTSGKLIHRIAECWKLSDIPSHLLTEDILNLQDRWWRTVWHIAAQRSALRTLPRHLLTEEILNTRDLHGESVFSISSYDALNDIPAHLITHYSIEKQKETVAQAMKLVLIRNTRTYNIFVKDNPHLAKDLEFIDSRFKLLDVEEDRLSFCFNDLTVVLNKDGAFLNNENHDTLNNVVTFIENTYPNIEKLPLYNSLTTQILPFTL